MPLRSKPITIKAVQNRTDTISYRVLGTIVPKGKQRRQHFACMDDALAAQAAWEAERMGVRAALRPKITRLNLRQLAQAEAAIELLKGTGLTIIDATRHALRNPPPAQSTKKLGTAHRDFLEDRKPFVGPRTYEALRLTGERFIRFVGEKTLLAEVGTDHVRKWMVSNGEISKKSWNNYRGDLFTFFEWCLAKPRAWVTDNPVKPISRHDIVRSLPERLEVETARELMAYLEKEKPQWCLFFAIALFLGVRPDMTNGEMGKLAAAVRRGGEKKHFCNGVLHITADLAKDKRPRQTQIPANVTAWIEKHPVTAEALNPDDWDGYGEIRKKFKIPHDGLRHTAISAHVSFHGSFADAASQFGNSESMIRTHYFNRMTKAEAEQFYQIKPMVACCPGTEPIAEAM